MCAVLLPPGDNPIARNKHMSVFVLQSLGIQFSRPKIVLEMFKILLSRQNCATACIVECYVLQLLVCNV